jgi:hypothetical protein
MDNPADPLVDGKGDLTAATSQVNFLLYLCLDIQKSKYYKMKKLSNLHEEREKNKS